MLCCWKKLKILFLKNFIYWFLEREERKKHWFAVLLIYAFIGWFLYVPWLGIKLATVAHKDDEQSNWATWPWLKILLKVLIITYGGKKLTVHSVYHKSFGSFKFRVFVLQISISYWYIYKDMYFFINLTLYCHITYKWLDNFWHVLLYLEDIYGLV